jgi:DNA-binding NtrC family response regulator
VHGPRAKRAFVTIDCASLSASLIDSELFGHERGAFTDAVAARPGRFELAGDGTVYIDAVAELPLETQGKLLRIVEDKHVQRLGGHTTFTIGARIIASADSGIEDAVREGAFRTDLYHRLRVLPIFVPALRDHADDVLPLAQYFASRAATTAGTPAPVMSRDVVTVLRDYTWPGNIRELRHVIERACDAAGDGPMTLDHLPAEMLEAPAVGAEGTLTRRPTLDEVERRYIAATLKHARGNQTDAAKLLGISRKSLWEKRKRYGLD